MNLWFVRPLSINVKKALETRVFKAFLLFILRGLILLLHDYFFDRRLIAFWRQMNCIDAACTIHYVNIYKTRLRGFVIIAA